MSQGKCSNRFVDWLREKLDEGTIEGCEWVDRWSNIFKILWKHKSNPEWREDDCLIFKEWAKFTGKYTEGMPPDWVNWKHSFRCILQRPRMKKKIKECKKYTDKNYRSFRFSRQQAKGRDSRKRMVECGGLMSSPVPECVGDHRTSCLSPVPEYAAECTIPIGSPVPECAAERRLSCLSPAPECIANWTTSILLPGLERTEECSMDSSSDVSRDIEMPEFLNACLSEPCNEDFTAVASLGASSPQNSLMSNKEDSMDIDFDTLNVLLEQTPWDLLGDICRNEIYFRSDWFIDDGESRNDEGVS